MTSSFHVDHQEAAVINMVAGDQNVNGTQAGTVVVQTTLADAREAAVQLQAILEAVGLGSPMGDPPTSDLAGITGELTKQEPDRGRVAARLRRLIEVILSTGSVAGAANEIARSVSVLVQWLGPVGAHLQGLIPALAAMA